jgi:MFS family permease
MVSHNLPWSVAMRSLHGVGDGLIFLVMYYGIARLFALDRLGGNTGFVSMATMLGYVFGALVYGGLSESYGYALPMWLSGAISCGLACVLWPLFIRDPGRPAPTGSDSGLCAEKTGRLKNGS